MINLLNIIDKKFQRNIEIMSLVLFIVTVLVFLFYRYTIILQILQAISFILLVYYLVFGNYLRQSKDKINIKTIQKSARNYNIIGFLNGIIFFGLLIYFIINL